MDLELEGLAHTEKPRQRRFCTCVLSCMGRIAPMGSLPTAQIEIGVKRRRRRTRTPD